MTSSRKPPISKSDETKFSDLEAHIMFLDHSLRMMSRDYFWYKVVAAEARVLVGDTKQNLRLLPYCVERFQFEAELNTNLVVNTQGQLEEPGGPLSIAAWCQTGYCASIYDKHFAVSEFVRTIAQQEGTSHEGNAIDWEIHQSHQEPVSGLPPHVVQLYKVAARIRLLAITFFSTMAHARHYETEYEWPEPGVHRNWEPKKKGKRVGVRFEEAINIR